MKITTQNYEEWMIDYIEGNLSAAQEKELREFLTFHPELQKELDAFSMTRLTPDPEMVFPDKASLKKAVEGGRVINMFAWVRYTAAAAAMFALFIGIRYFGGAKQENGIQQYAYEQPGVSGFSRKTDATAKAENINTISPKGSKVKKVIVPEIQIAEIKNEGSKRELNPIQEIEFAQTGTIIINDNVTIKDLNDVPEYEMAYVDAQKGTVIENSTIISLNDNKTVVDWWIDAVAIGSEVGDVAKGVLEADLNPLKRVTAEEEEVKTRNISVPGFNYYSRKSNN